MGFFSRLFGGDSAATAPADAPRNPVPPPAWAPTVDWEHRLAAYARRVAGELRTDGVRPSHAEGGFWVISYDVYEAVWYPAARGSWAEKNNRIRDGWSQGSALLLFESGELARADFFTEMDPRRSSGGISKVRAPEGLEDHRWSAGNLARWRSGGGGLVTHANEHFKGFWPGPRDGKPFPPGAGTSSLLKKFATDRVSAVPRYY